MRLVSAATALLLVLLVAAAPASAQQQRARQSAQLALSTTDANAPTGARLDLQFRNESGDPNAKPHTIQSVTIDYPESTRFDFTVPERCDASDAQLAAGGAAACPPGSVVARGRLDTDSGSPGAFPRYVENEITTFNGSNQGELITLAESKNPQTRMVSRARVVGARLVIEFPSVPGNPPPDPYLAYKRLLIAGQPITKDERTYLRTPPACPSSGAWTTRFAFTYRDGVTQRQEVAVPCRVTGEPTFDSGIGAPTGEPVDDPAFVVPRDRPAPRVRLGRLDRCVRHAFVIRVRVNSESRLRHVVVKVDGKRVAVRRTSAFRVRVDVRKLRRGRHLLEVVARDRVGDLGQAQRRFRRC
jgi:hypothetical protein